MLNNLMKAALLLFLATAVSAQNIRVAWTDNLATIQWDETLADSTAAADQVPFSIMTGPYISWLTDSTARIAWEVIAEKSIMDTSPYFIGYAGYPFATKLRIHSVKLTGLKADSAYRYRLLSTNGLWTYSGQEYTFRTFPLKDGKRLRFALVGDTQNGWAHPLAPGKGGMAATVAKIDRLICQWNPPLVIHIGDITQDGGDTNWAPGKVNWIVALNNLKFIHSSFLALTPGNHDGAGFIKQYFKDYVEEAGSVTPPNFPPHLYSFEAANVHFISYSGSPSKSQSNTWMNFDLSNNRKPWKIIFGHYAIHGVAYPEVTPDAAGYTSLVPKYGVQLRLTGHDHAYERSRRITPDNSRSLTDTGMVEIINVSQPGRPQNLLPTPYWNLFCSPKAHYVRGEVDDSLIYFTAIDEDGLVTDRWKMPLIGQPVTLFDNEPFEMVDDKDTMVVKYDSPWTVTDRSGQRWVCSTWTHNRLNVNCFRSSSSYTDIAGSFVEFSFSGTSVGWIGQKSSSSGKADVYIDGVLDRADVDLYASTGMYQQEIYVKSGLTPGNHTIKIVINGKKNPSATGNVVDIDAFNITNGAGSSTEQPDFRSCPALPVTFLSRPGLFSVQIHSPGPHSVIAMDIRGRVIKRMHGRDKAEFHLSKREVATGTYFIKVTAQGRKFARSVVLW